MVTNLLDNQDLLPRSSTMDPKGWPFLNELGLAHTARLATSSNELLE
jgi:hypothetical protein